MSTTQHPESEWLDRILLKLCTCGATDDKHYDNGTLQCGFNEAKSQILAKLKSAEIEGRIAEAKYLYQEAKKEETEILKVAGLKKWPKNSFWFSKFFDKRIADAMAKQWAEPAPSSDKEQK